MLYRPIIKFASKERAKTPVAVLFVEHMTATFPQLYKTRAGATNFARRNLVGKYLDDVWQLPGCQEMSQGD